MPGRKINNGVLIIQPSTFKLGIPEKLVFFLYQLLWSIATPFLGCNKRLKYGFQERILHKRPAEADLWIQSASVGEAYLSLELVKKLSSNPQIRILLTTNTKQGMEILEKARSKNIAIAYFPFDNPKIIAKAIKSVSPKVVVLLESELWPGLLKICKSKNIKTLLINGRMTSKSLSRYLIWPAFWKNLRPGRILAMSEDHAQRFSSLFGSDIVDTMHNIKFDRIMQEMSNLQKANPLSALFDSVDEFIVFGSVRLLEADDVVNIIKLLRNKNDKTIFGIFPRHMERIGQWIEKLESCSLPFQLRSKSSGQFLTGSIIIWDTMGELSHAYGICSAAFVGGSLKPLGGHNFLEPLTYGIKPVIGPYWSDFSWVGKEIFAQNLVLQAENWQKTAELIIEQVACPQDREEIRQSIINYVKNRQGGTQKSCEIIQSFLA